jgi:hypothetical protein
MCLFATARTVSKSAFKVHKAVSRLPRATQKRHDGHLLQVAPVNQRAVNRFDSMNYASSRIFAA